MELERRVADERLVSKFDVGDVSVDALLFQTGYLTLTGEERKGAQTFYTLDYPNLEVRQSLNDGLLGYLGKTGKETYDQGKELARLLADNDFDGFAVHLRAFFAGIPYLWHSKGDMARYEAWYAGMLYACFRTIGLDLRVEDASSRGRSDMVLLPPLTGVRTGTQGGARTRRNRQHGAPPAQSHPTDATARLRGEVPPPGRTYPLGGTGFRLAEPQPGRREGGAGLRPSTRTTPRTTPSHTSGLEGQCAALA